MNVFFAISLLPVFQQSAAALNVVVSNSDAKIQRIFESRIIIFVFNTKLTFAK